MKQYHRRPDETAAVVTADGWFKTGDIGALDADGFLSITGRKKEMIIVSGENVFPVEIEQALLEHPAVERAAVIGTPDPVRVEVPVAFVTLKDGAAADALELRRFARERLAGFKVPREVRVSQDLPLGPTGKVLKRKLGDWIEPRGGDPTADGCRSGASDGSGPPATRLPPGRPDANL
jgi:long-chain acyl-CoA synthetase